MLMPTDCISNLNVFSCPLGFSILQHGLLPLPLPAFSTVNPHQVPAKNWDFRLASRKDSGGCKVISLKHVA